MSVDARRNIMDKLREKLANAKKAEEGGKEVGEAEKRQRSESPEMEAASSSKSSKKSSSPTRTSTRKRK
jgi:hypothetical protein